MIVVCERCSSKYRINEEKLPAGGGNIKCPSCQHVFFVAPPSEAAPSSQLPRRPGGAATDDIDDSKTVVGTMPSALLGNPTAGDSSSFESHLGGGAPPTFAAAAAASSTNPISGEPASGAQGWKLKTNFGLIYEFPDDDSLRNWLSVRDNLDGYKLSRDGKSFKDLSEYPELSAEASTSSSVPKAVASPAPQPAPTPLTGSTQAQTPRPKPAFEPSPRRPSAPLQRRDPVPVVRAPVELPPRRDDNSSTTAIVLVAVALLGVVLVLQVTGVIDLRKNVSEKRDAARASVAEGFEGQVKKLSSPNATVITEDDEEEDEEDYAFEEDDEEEESGIPDPRKVPINPLSHTGHVQTLLDRAEDEARDGNYTKAASTLNMAKGLDPRNPSIYRQLEDVYNAMGNEKAESEARAKRRALEDN